MYQALIKGKDNPNVMVKGQPKIVGDTDYAKYYKVILRSKDADTKTYNNNDGTPNQCIFNKVNLPEGVDGNAVIVFDSFVAENKTNELDGGYTVSIKEVLQPRTWGSDKKGSTDILLTGKGSVWQNGSVQASSCGIPVTNLTMFRNTRLTIQIDSIKANDTTFSVQGDWVLTFFLVIFNGDNEFKV